MFSCFGLVPKKHKGSGVMDDWPPLFVEQILNFCDIRHVFVCKSVNKTFHAAAKSAIRNRKALAIVDRAGIPSAVAPIDIIDTSGMDWEDFYAKQAMMESLNEFGSLQVLMIWERDDSFDQIIVSNCMTLTKIISILPFPSKNEVKYAQLKELECESLPFFSKDAFPRLQSLKVKLQRQPEPFLNLNPETMKKLDCEFTTTEIGSSLPVLIRSINRLSSLTYLHLGIDNDTGDLHRYGIPDSVATPLFSLFQSFTDLQHLFLTAFTGLDMDAVTIRVVQKNPALQYLSLQGMRLTDDSVNEIAKLKNLTSIGLVEVGRLLTGDGIMTLLKGGSREKLRHLHFDAMNIEIFEEIELMAGEAGMVVQQKSGRNSSVKFYFEEGKDF